MRSEGLVGAVVCVCCPSGDDGGLVFVVSASMGWFAFQSKAGQGPAAHKGSSMAILGSKASLSPATLDLRESWVQGKLSLEPREGTAKTVSGTQALLPWILGKLGLMFALGPLAVESIKLTGRPSCGWVRFLAVTSS